MKDELGDRMKSYENIETSRKFDGRLPVYARIDGRGFSRFTRNMTRPFDRRLSAALRDVTKRLVENTNAVVGYVQSDEISLAWKGSVEENRLFFAGKIQKQCSVLASMTAAFFARSFAEQFGYHSDDAPHFDCRVFEVPNETELANMFLWRANDASRNAINMLARHHFSHRDLQGRSTNEILSMLGGIGVDINNQPTVFTNGAWFKRIREKRILDESEISMIPIQHRPDPSMEYDRHRVAEIYLADFHGMLDRPLFISSDSIENHTLTPSMMVL